MGSPPQGPCSSWAEIEDVQLCAGSPYDDIDAYVIEDMLPIATDLLWRLGGPAAKRFTGVCEATVRPCADRASTWNSPIWERAGAAGYTSFGWGGASGGWWWGFGGWDSSWGSCGCGSGSSLGAPCGCTGLSTVRLGPVPIVEVTEVVVDGGVLDPTEYRVDNWTWLVRLPNVDDPNQTQQWWPCCQDMSLPLTEEGTFGVTFSYGTAPTAAGVEACAVLAGELALARCGGECSLPDSVVRSSREGVDFALITPDTADVRLYPEPVRRWLQATNPNKLTTSPSVWSPDVGRSTVQAGT